MRPSEVSRLTYGSIPAPYSSPGICAASQSTGVSGNRTCLSAHSSNHTQLQGRQKLLSHSGGIPAQTQPALSFPFPLPRQQSQPQRCRWSPRPHRLHLKLLPQGLRSAPVPTRCCLLGLTAGQPDASNSNQMQVISP